MYPCFRGAYPLTWVFFLRQGSGGTSTSEQQTGLYGRNSKSFDLALTNKGKVGDYQNQRHLRVTTKTSGQGEFIFGLEHEILRAKDIATDSEIHIV